ncbi:MAG: hypothetical protein KDG54_20795, partial [Geminicoccaceae bacterium]|nr:hypothetical protein [Geminicoccaceae bacterium]
PIYLGMAVLVAGFALWLGSLSPWIGPPAYVALISGRFIRGEEAKLERAFGPAFERYRRRVRRWI